MGPAALFYVIVFSFNLIPFTALMFLSLIIISAFISQTLACPKEKLNGIKDYDRLRVSPVRPLNQMTIIYQSTYRTFTLRLKKLTMPQKTNGFYEYNGTDISSKASIANGILANGTFYGQVHLESSAYYLANPRLLFSAASLKRQLNPNLIIIRAIDIEQFGPSEAEKSNQNMIRISNELLQEKEPDLEKMVLSPNRVCPMKIIFDHKYLQNKSADGYDEALARFDGVAYANMLVSLANLIPNFYGIKFRIAEIEFGGDCSSLATCDILPTERNYVNIFHEKLESHNWENFCSVVYFAHSAQFGGFNGVASAPIRNASQGVCAQYTRYAGNRWFTTNVAMINTYGRLSNVFGVVNTLAHEQNHLLGALHDPLEQHMCAPGGKNDLDSNYLMYPVAPIGRFSSMLLKTPFLPSPCTNKFIMIAQINRLRVDIPQNPEDRNCFTLI